MELRNNYPTLFAPTPDPKEYTRQDMGRVISTHIRFVFIHIRDTQERKKNASWHRDILFYTISLPSLLNVWNEIVITIVKGEKNFWFKKKTFLCFFIPLFKIYIVFSLYLFICLKGYVVIAFIYVFPLFLCF